MHLREALEGLSLNPALLRRLIAWRRGRGVVGTRPDLTPGLIDEMIATDRDRLLRSPAFNAGLPDPFRLQLARHPDASVRASLAVGCVA